MSIRNVWRGDAGLALTYWVYGVLGGAVLGIPLAFVTPGSALAIIEVFCLVTFLIWVNVGIWRAAGKYKGPKIWSFLSRAQLIFVLVSLVIGIAAAVLIPMLNEAPEEIRKVPIATAPANQPLAVVPPPASVQDSWIRIATSAKGVEIFLNPSTIRNVGLLKRHWQLQDGVTRSDGVGSSKTLLETDCVEEKFRILDSTRYSGRMGEGEIIHHENRPSEWIYVQPDSVARNTLKIVCAG